MSELAEAIEKSVGEIGEFTEEGGSGEKSDEKKVSTSDKTEKSDDDKESDKSGDNGESDESEELTDEEVANAKQIFKALKDPNQAPTLVKILAEQAGYLKAPETKKEAAEQTKDIIAKLREAAGPELDFLIDKIGPVLKEELASQVNSVRSELRVDQVNRENEKMINETKVAMVTLAQKYYSKNDFPSDVYKEMSGLMNKVNPTPGMKPSDYIEMLYFAVAGKKGINVNNPAQGKRQEANRTNTMERLASDRSAKGQEIADVPRKMTLNEAIALATKKVEDGEG